MDVAVLHGGSGRHGAGAQLSSQAQIKIETDVTSVGKGLWEPSMGVPMVVVGRGIHAVGYTLLAIKSIG